MSRTSVAITILGLIVIPRQIGSPDPCPVPTIKLCAEKFLLLKRMASLPPLVATLSDPDQQPTENAIMRFTEPEAAAAQPEESQ